MNDKGRRQRFGRMVRLRARSSFVAAQHHGRRIAGRNLVLYALCRPERDCEARARIGLVVSKKVGNAVVRNRVKRWLRESFRRIERPAPGIDLVVIARPATAEGTWQSTAEELGNLIGRVKI